MDQYSETYFRGRKMSQVLSDPFSPDLKTAGRYREAANYAQLLEQETVLDLACGLGTGSWVLAQHCGHIVGLDISEYAIHFARQTYQRDSLSFVLADIFTWETDQLFDIIFCLDILEHVDSTQSHALLSRTAQLLAPDGRVYLRVPITNTLLGYYLKLRHGKPGAIDHTGDPTHRVRFSLASLKRLLDECGFQIERMDTKCSYRTDPLVQLANAGLRLVGLQHQFADYLYTDVAQLLLCVKPPASERKI